MYLSQKKLQTCHIRFPSSIPGHSKLIQISGNDHKMTETHPESNAHNKKQTAPPNQHQSTQSQNNGHNRGQNQRITPGMDEMDRKHTTFPSNRFQRRIGWYNKRSNKLAKGQRSGVKRPHPSRDFDHDKYTSFMNNNPWKTQKERNQHQETRPTSHNEESRDETSTKRRNQQQETRPTSRNEESRDGSRSNIGRNQHQTKAEREARKYY